MRLLSLLTASAAFAIVTLSPLAASAEIFPCDEAGILDAIAAGGGPHTFNCGGPTVVVTSAEISVDNDVILDGNDDLTLSGGDDHRVVFVQEGVSAEIRRLTIREGFNPGVAHLFTGLGGGIRNDGALQILQSQIVANAAASGGGIYNSGSMTIRNSHISLNTGGGLRNVGALEVFGSTVEINLDFGVISSDNLSLFGTEVARNARGGVTAGGTSLISESIIAENVGAGLANYGTMTLSESLITRNIAATNLDAVGGILNVGTLVVSASIVSNNSGGLRGVGGIRNKPRVTGGVRSPGILTMVDSRVSGNSSETSTAGIDSGSGGLTLIRCEVVDNHVSDANILFSAGGILSSSRFGQTIIQDSLIAENSVTSRFFASGAGLRNTGQTEMIVTNTTISGNSIRAPAAALGTAIQTRSSSLTRLNHVTIAGNEADGAMLSFALNGEGAITVENSLIQGNCLASDIVSGGGNLESPGDTCGFDSDADQVEVAEAELSLGPLKDAGGPTRTHPLLAESPAIDSALFETCPETDQRGLRRPVGGGCDVGAFELGASAPLRCEDAEAVVEPHRRRGRWRARSHSVLDVSIAGIVSAAGENASIEITSVSQDEPTSRTLPGRKGASRRDSCPDAEIVSANQVRLRRQRAPGGNGRVYHLSFVAQNEAGASCSGEVSVCVPRSRGAGECIDDEARFDSTQCTNPVPSGRLSWHPR